MSSKGDIAEAPAMGNSSPNTRASQQRKKEPFTKYQSEPAKKERTIENFSK